MEGRFATKKKEQPARRRHVGGEIKDEIDQTDFAVAPDSGIIVPANGRCFKYSIYHSG